LNGGSSFFPAKAAIAYRSSFVGFGGLPPNGSDSARRLIFRQCRERRRMYAEKVTTSALRTGLAKLYETDLMFGGGHVAGYAVDEAQGERVVQAVHALGSRSTFVQRYGVPDETPVMLFAVGDGNHSLATAEAFWESTKEAVGMSHPSRFALVEVENIHGDDALERLAMNSGSVGIHLPTVSKDSLLRMVVREGPLPRKAFSMVEANEKRFYIEARRIRHPTDAPSDGTLQSTRTPELPRHR